MYKIKQKHIHIVLGCFFLFLQILVLIANAHAVKFDDFFWFCAHSPLIFALAFFFNKPFISKALINFGFVGQFIWTIDFLGRIFFGTHFLRVTEYVFANPFGPLTLIPIAIHMLSTNVALYYTYKRKPTLKIFFISVLYILVVYAYTVSFTEPAQNINCIYSICGAPALTFEGFTNFWPILAILLIVLPTHGLQYLLYWLHKKRKKVRKREHNIEEKKK